MLWTSEKRYQPDPFETEAQLEAAVIEVSPTLFGANRIYLEVKRRIGAKGKTKNIPDGFLLDLALFDKLKVGRNNVLFVPTEIELPGLPIGVLSKIARP